MGFCGQSHLTRRYITHFSWHSFCAHILGGFKMEHHQKQPIMKARRALGMYLLNKYNVQIKRAASRHSVPFHFPRARSVDLIILVKNRGSAAHSKMAETRTPKIHWRRGGFVCFVGTTPKKNACTTNSSFNGLILCAFTSLYSLPKKKHDHSILIIDEFNRLYKNNNHSILIIDEWRATCNTSF